MLETWGRWTSSRAHEAKKLVCVKGQLSAYLSVSREQNAGKQELEVRPREGRGGTMKAPRCCLQELEVCLRGNVESLKVGAVSWSVKEESLRVGKGGSQRCSCAEVLGYEVRQREGAGEKGFGGGDWTSPRD